MCNFFWLFDTINSVIASFIDWIIIKPSIDGYFEYLNKVTSNQNIAKSNSNISVQFRNNDPTLKYFLFDQFSVNNIYENYLNVARDFDPLQSLYEFKVWIKNSRFALFLHQVIDMLVIII